MKKMTLAILIFLSYSSYSQLFEGQNFCEESKGYSYFPLKINKKKILWYDTFYIETKNEIKVFNGKIYFEFHQKWENFQFALLYLREENGIIFQYEECCEQETVRYNPNFEIGYSWKSASGESEYRLIAFNGKLKTPFCEYENLLVIEAKMSYGNFNFYYLKGHGYMVPLKMIN